MEKYVIIDFLNFTCNDDDKYVTFCPESDHISSNVILPDAKT